MKCSERFANAALMRDLNSTQMIQLLSLPDAEETERFIAEKAAEGKQVAEMTIRQLREGQEIGKLVLLAEARLGELFNQLPKQTANNPNGRAGKQNNQFPPAGKLIIAESEDENGNEEEPPPKPKLVVAAEMGFNKNQVAQFQKLADNPNAVQQAIGMLQISLDEATSSTLE